MNRLPDVFDHIGSLPILPEGLEVEIGTQETKQNGKKKKSKNKNKAMISSRKNKKLKEV